MIIPVRTKTSDEKEMEVSLSVDTGSNEYIALFDNAIKKYGLIDKRKRYKTISGFSVDKTVTKNFKGKIKSLNIDNIQWKKIPTKYVVAEQNIQSNGYQASEYGRIEQKILMDCNIIYDYANSVMYIDKIKLLLANKR